MVLVTSTISITRRRPGTYTWRRTCRSVGAVDAGSLRRAADRCRSSRPGRSPRCSRSSPTMKTSRMAGSAVLSSPSHSRWSPPSRGPRGPRSRVRRPGGSAARGRRPRRRVDRGQEIGPAVEAPARDRAHGSGTPGPAAPRAATGTDSAKNRLLRERARERRVLEQELEVAGADEGRARRNPFQRVKAWYTMRRERIADEDEHDPSAGSA